MENSGIMHKMVTFCNGIQNINFILITGCKKDKKILINFIYIYFWCEKITKDSGLHPLGNINAQKNLSTADAASIAKTFHHVAPLSK